MKNTWQSVLNLNSERVTGNQINLDNTWIRFLEDEDGRGAGVSAFCLEADDNDKLFKKASDLSLVYEDHIMIGGVKFLLS